MMKHDNSGILKTDKSPTDLEHVAIQLESMLPRSAKYHIWHLNVENISLNFTSSSSSSDSIYLAKQNMTDTLSMIDAIVKLPTPTLSSLSEVDIESNVHDISDTNVIIDILSTSVPILVSKMKIEKLITNKNLDLSEQKQSKFEGNIQCGLEIIARCSRDSFISSSVNMSDNSNKTSSQ
ncbi:unnamed protein product [Rotaria sp. Silwood1]|nr:unnamed protein product [Rotaria sp. Silwood1]